MTIAGFVRPGRGPNNSQKFGTIAGFAQKATAPTSRKGRRPNNSQKAAAANNPENSGLLDVYGQLSDDVE